MPESRVIISIQHTTGDRPRSRHELAELLQKQLTELEHQGIIFNGFDEELIRDTAIAVLVENKDSLLDTPKPEVGHTPGPWTAYRMTHAETGELLTPEQIGEYVCNSVKKSAEVSGSLDFLFISVEKPDGPADVCHVGNGPTSPANARLIAAAPDLYEAAKHAVMEWRLHGQLTDSCRVLEAAIAKAEGQAP